LRNKLRQARIAQHHPAPRRHAIGLVAEFLRPQVVKIAQHVALEQFGVQFGDAVDRVTAGGGEVRHAHEARPVLVDQRHARQALVVAEESDPHLVQEPGVDLVDDFQVPRQHAAEQVQRPALQRLGQQRVVGIGEGLARDAPGQVPVERHFVDQQPHQFGHRDRRMGVVELHCEFLVEALRRDLLHPVDAQHVLQRTGDKEVLLLQAQLLALDLLVIRIQHLGDVLRGDLLVDRAPVIAAVEGGEIERLGRLGTPQA
jgi:hypothetical protein